MRAAPHLAAALVLALVACVAEPTGVRRAAVVDGTPVDGDQAVVALLPRRTHCEEEAAAVACTGILVAPRVVLTAAHCFDVFGRQGRSYEVYFGSDALGATGEHVLGEEVLLHPDYDGEGHTHDVALLRLAGPAPVEPLALSTMTVDDTLVGAEARVVGFGITRDDSMPEGIKREGTTRITGVGETTFTAERAPSMTCQGDSGGPVFVDVDGTPELVGVTVSGDPACDLEAVNVRMDVLTDSFIAPFVAEAADAPEVLPSGAFEPAMLCGTECTTHADCPLGMLCEDSFAGRECRLPARGPGALTDACTADAQCMEEGSVCARVWPSGDDCRCHVPCSEMSPPMDDDGGCSAAGPPPKTPPETLPTPMAWWVLASVLLWRRRR